jgi:hypothetical protein
MTGSEILLAEVRPGFDYGVEAEFFPGRSWGGRTGRPVPGYRRFARAADAIRFAIEELSPARLHGACLEVDEQRYDGEAIRRLYDSADYPLARGNSAIAQEPRS